MSLLILLAVAACLFFAMPWLAIAFSRYCDAVNRISRRRQRTGKDGAVCSAYRVPTTSADSGLCAGCGMYDYKHRERP